MLLMLLMTRGMDKVFHERMSFRVIENLMTLKEPINKIRVIWILLKVQALFDFEHHPTYVWRKKINTSLKMIS
jgi:hypothetical protein